MRTLGKALEIVIDEAKSAMVPNGFASPAVIWVDGAVQMRSALAWTDPQSHTQRREPVTASWLEADLLYSEDLRALVRCQILDAMSWVREAVEAEVRRGGGMRGVRTADGDGD